VRGRLPDADTFALIATISCRRDRSDRYGRHHPVRQTSPFGRRTESWPAPQGASPRGASPRGASPRGASPRGASPGLITPPPDRGGGPGPGRPGRTVPPWPPPGCWAGPVNRCPQAALGCGVALTARTRIQLPFDAIESRRQHGSLQQVGEGLAAPSGSRSSSRWLSGNRTMWVRLLPP